MSTSPDLSFLRKRDGIEDFDLPASAVAGIAIGVLIIVAASVWFCCPCWKWCGARPSPLRRGSEEGKEDYGKERALGSDITAKGGNRIRSEPRDRSTIVSPLSTVDGSPMGIRGGDRSTLVSPQSTGSGTLMGSELSGRSYNEGLNEADGTGLGPREMDALPTVNEVSGQGLSPPPQYEQIQRKPLVSELPAEPIASFQRPEKN